MTRFQNCAVLVCCLISIGFASGGPPSREEAERREKLVKELKQALVSESTVAAKFEIFERAIKAEPSPNLRRVIIESVPHLPGPELDAFLINVLTADLDAGMARRNKSATSSIDTNYLVLFICRS